MSIEPQLLKRILEGVLLVAGEPIKLEKILQLFEEVERPSSTEIKSALDSLREDYAERGIMLQEVASGYCLQVNAELYPWVSKLWEERPPRYSRALLETLALIAYRQPITRAEIEEVRGVSVSSAIIKTLLEREWIQVVGHRDVPGKPALYATTRQFLDNFNLKSLNELPALVELQSIDEISHLDKPTEMLTNIAASTEDNFREHAKSGDASLAATTDEVAVSEEASSSEATIRIDELVHEFESV